MVFLPCIFLFWCSSKLKLWWNLILQSQWTKSYVQNVLGTLTIFVTCLWFMCTVCVQITSQVEIKMGFLFKSHYLLSQIYQYLDELLILCLKLPNSYIWNAEGIFVSLNILTNRDINYWEEAGRRPESVWLCIWKTAWIWVELEAAALFRTIGLVLSSEVICV